MKVFYLLFSMMIFSFPGISQDRGSIKVKKKEEKTGIGVAIKADISRPLVCGISEASHRDSERNIFEYAISIETELARRHSFQLTWSQFGRNYQSETRTADYYHYQRRYVVPEYKCYWNSEKVCTGFYSSIFGQQLYGHDSYGDYGHGSVEYKYLFSGFGLTTGYQNYFFQGKLVLDVFLGYGYEYRQKMDVSSDVGTIGVKYQPKQRPLYRGALNIGYRF